MHVKHNFQVYVVFLHTRLKFEPNCFIHNGIMTSTVFRAILAAILDFERGYPKMLKGARVASNGFLIRTSESTDFNKKTLSRRQVQVHLLFYWTTTARPMFSATFDLDRTTRTSLDVVDCRFKRTATNPKLEITFER